MLPQIGNAQRTGNPVAGALDHVMMFAVLGIIVFVCSLIIKFIMKGFNKAKEKNMELFVTPEDKSKNRGN